MLLCLFLSLSLSLSLAIVCIYIYIHIYIYMYKLHAYIRATLLAFTYGTIELRNCGSETQKYRGAESSGLHSFKGPKELYQLG